jgi:hypothetical protein
MKKLHSIAFLVGTRMILHNTSIHILISSPSSLSHEYPHISEMMDDVGACKSDDDDGGGIIVNS